MQPTQHAKNASTEQATADACILAAEAATHKHIQLLPTQPPYKCTEPQAIETMNLLHKNTVRCAGQHWHDRQQLHCSLSKLSTAAAAAAAAHRFCDTSATSTQQCEGDLLTRHNM
jgi:hypothetical protein